MDTTQPVHRTGNISRSVAGLDACARKLDDFFGGVNSVPLFHRRSLLAFWLPIPVLFFAIYGPAAFGAGGGPMFRGWAAACLLLGAIAVQWVYFVRVRRHMMRWLHLGLVTACSAGTWFLASGNARENSEQLYRHGYGPAAFLALFSVGVIAPRLAALPIFTLPTAAQDAFRQAFQAERVLEAPPPVPVTGRDLVRAAITAVIDKPLHIVVPAAGLTLFAPAVGLGWYALGWLLSCFVLSTMAHLDPARDAIVRFIGRSLLSGSASVVSLVVVGLVVCRLLSIDYVTTVLDASSAWTVFSYLAAAYSLIWLHDFWVHQSAIDSLSDRTQRRQMLASEPGATGALDTLAPEGVRIVRHGEGRVRVSLAQDDTRFRVFEPGALLRRIAHTSDEDRDRLELLAAQSQARLTGFTACSNMVLALCLFGGWYAAQGTSEEPPMLSDAPGAFDLSTHLVGDASPAIFVAASGGGTRAALYATAVLHGIQRTGHAHDVTAISSVSGGGAASAYFASDYAALSQNGELGEAAWKRMRDALAKPFIQDVLAGAFEWRIIGQAYLGQLLTESFEKHFWTGVPARRMRRRLSDVRELGLIYNAAVCGIESQGESSSREGGGFVLITNTMSSFEPANMALGWPESLPLIAVSQPQLPLTRAAAISANFPPVFSNIPLVHTDRKTGAQQRLWLTDGGAVENRALIPLLIALSEAIAKVPSGVRIRPLRVVVAEASAFDTAYHTDRGIGAKFGAATQLANGYVAALNDRIYNQLAARQDAPVDFRVIYLPMPDALRAAGTFGTHWMMPPRVPLGAPAESKLDKQMELTAADVVDLVDALISQDARSYVERTFPADSEQLIERLALDRQPSLWQQLHEGLEGKASAQPAR